MQPLYDPSLLMGYLSPIQVGSVLVCGGRVNFIVCFFFLYILMVDMLIYPFQSIVKGTSNKNISYLAVKFFTKILR